MADLRTELRDRLTLRNALAAAGIAALWGVVLDAPPLQLAATLASAAIVGAGDLLADAYDREELEQSALGVAALLGAGLLARFGDAGPSVLAALGTVGAWLTADGIQQLRHGPPDGQPEQAADGTEVYRRYVAGQVQNALDDRPHTRRELREALAADGEVVDAALDLLESRGAVERAGSTYRRADPDAGGRLSTLQDKGIGAARRLARPLTVEFRATDDEAAPDRRRATSEPRTGAGDQGSADDDDRGGRDEREPVGDRA